MPDYVVKQKLEITVCVRIQNVRTKKAAIKKAKEQFPDEAIESLYMGPGADPISQPPMIGVIRDREDVEAWLEHSEEYDIFSWKDVEVEKER